MATTSTSTDPVTPSKNGNNDADKVERVMSADEVEFAKEHQNYEKLDKELANYVSEARIEISPEKNAELRRMIDKRVLTIMVGTYFLQAIDKGTLSFSSIM